MFNCLDLKCPSDDLSEYPPQDRYVIEELGDFVTLLSTAADTLTSENPLWNEMQVLRNIQVKYKRILRCDKCLIYLHRISHCLKKMVLLNLSKSYLDLAERFLIGLQDPSTTLHLPSRQQLEYVLIRTITTSRLVCEAIKYSRETFCYLIQKLKVGHLILDLVMASSVTARLNILLRAILEQLCSIYQQVLSWRYKLKSGKFPWVEKLDLPQNLGEWLKSFESGCFEPFPMSKDDIDNLSNLLKPNKEHNSDSESVILLDEVPNKDSLNAANDKKMNDTDYGEVIPRKKNGKSCDLTFVQKSLLQNIVRVQSLKDLEKLWNDINGFSSDYFPKALNKRKKEIINELFSQIRSIASTKKFNKSFEKQPRFLKTAVLRFCKYLGFTQKHIKMCKEDLSVSNGLHAPKLVPVKTLKELKILYRQLCEILKFTNETEGHRKLRKFFRSRTADIKLLKQNGEKGTARKLILCTSKLLLTLCQK